jgi:cytochrome P450
MLIMAEDEDGQRMTDKQLRDEAVTLFLAGHETTANTMNWTFMLLAQNPEIAKILHEELDTVLAGRTPNLADLRNLPYTEMVIKESMRLYPPVPGAGRQAIEDVQIGEYLIPKGTNVGTFWYAAHLNPLYWDEPMAFRPERFSKENEATINRYAYLPFGGGPRICVGNSFAMMEAQILLATIAQKFTLSLDPNHIIKPEARITMYPKDGLPMTAHEREPIQQPEFA